MENLSKFCTCRDLKCPFHPTNHSKGCSLCIAKNLKEGEIPSCFSIKWVMQVEWKAITMKICKAGFKE